MIRQNWTSWEKKFIRSFHRYLQKCAKSSGTTHWIKKSHLYRLLRMVLSMKDMESWMSKMKKKKLSMMEI